MTESNQDAINVVVSIDFSEEIMRQLRAVSSDLHIEQHHPDVPDSAYAEAEVLYTVSNFPAPAQAPNLRWIQVNYAGVERALEKPIIKDTGITLTSASGIHSVQISEYCLAMMLHFRYKISEMISLKAKAKWPEKPYNLFAHPGLRGQTVGIVGYGSIGRELARVVDALGMRVLATKRNLMQPSGDDKYAIDDLGDPATDIPDRLYPPEALGSMAEECDYLVIAVPLTDETRYMVNEAIFNRMKKYAVLINVARGGIVDEAALIKALKSRKIAGAAMDVFETEPLPADSPLWETENLVISPHISGNAMNYHQMAAELFAENLRRYLEKRPLLNVVQRERGY